MHYPGGFTKLISGMIGVDVTDETNRASRIPAGILLLLFTITPFVLKDCVVAVLTIASLGILEGFVHLMAIRLFHLKKFYSPGLITAELELLVSIALIVWLEQNNLASATDYILGFVIMFVCFVIMQKTITMMVGIKYSDVPNRLRKQWSK